MKQYETDENYKNLVCFVLFHLFRRLYLKYEGIVGREDHG
jgi:hypothetical protein